MTRAAAMNEKNKPTEVCAVCVCVHVCFVFVCDDCALISTTTMMVMMVGDDGDDGNDGDDGDSDEDGDKPCTTPHHRSPEIIWESRT
jgi:hypothetical protein